MLEIVNGSFRTAGHQLLHPTSARCQPGQLTVVLGANGAGKSTLLHLLAGLHAPTSGQVLLDGHDLAGRSPHWLARRRAMLSQRVQLSFELSVAEVVELGRYPHAAGRPGPHDQAVVQATLAKLGLTALAGRGYHTLSGGEAQKVQLARVLAQVWDAPPVGSRVLLLDEPVTALDPPHQHELLHQARLLARQGAVVVAVLHDLNLALTYADQLLLLGGGQLRYALAHPNQLTEEMLREVYGLPLRLVASPLSGQPLVLYEPAWD